MRSVRNLNPCLVCQELATGLKGGVVCSKCRRKIAHYDEIVNSGQTSTMNLPARWTNVYPVGNCGVDGARKDLEVGLIELYNAFPECDHDHDAPRVKCRGAGDNRFAKVPTALVAPLQKLQSLIDAYGKAANVEGHREGTNLLAQLNAGTLTGPDFEERVEYYRKS